MAENRFLVKKVITGLQYFISILFFTTVLAGFVGWIFQLVKKIKQGRGLDYYFTGFGVKMNSIAVLSALMTVPLVLLVGLAIRYWMRREEKDFLKKYGKKGDR